MTQTPAKTVQGQKVATVKISGKDYVAVTERIRVINEIGDDYQAGYEITGERWFEMLGRWFVTVSIRTVQGQVFHGTSEVKFNAPEKSADGMAPAECAETSAVGRALGLAGIGVLDSIASADEMQRSTENTTATASAETTQQTILASKLRAWLVKKGYTTVQLQDGILRQARVDVTRALHLAYNADELHLIYATVKAETQKAAAS